MTIRKSLDNFFKKIIAIPTIRNLIYIYNSIINIEFLYDFETLENLIGLLYICKSAN